MPAGSGQVLLTASAGNVASSEKLAGICGKIWAHEIAEVKTPCCIRYPLRATHPATVISNSSPSSDRRMVTQPNDRIRRIALFRLMGKSLKRRPPPTRHRSASASGSVICLSNISAAPSLSWLGPASVTRTRPRSKANPVSPNPISWRWTTISGNESVSLKMPPSERQAD